MKGVETKLEDLCEYITVGFVGSMTQHYREQGVLFLRSQNIEPFKLNLQPDQTKKISEDFHAKLRKSTLMTGDIAIVRTGYPGTAAVIPPGLGQVNCSDLVIARPKRGVNAHFLCNWINSPLGKAQIGGNLVGAAQQHFNVGAASRMKITVPSLQVQNKIASILSAYDDLIENNNERITLLENMAEEIYKEWFVRLRFPGNEDVEISESIPNGWSRSKVRDYIEYYIGGGWGEEFQKTGYESPAYVIRGTDMPGFRRGDVKHDILRFHKESNLNSRALQEGDIIFEVSGGTESQSLGRTCFVSSQVLDRYDKPLMCASFCKLIRPKQGKCRPVFLYQLLNRMYGTGELMVFQVQSTGISNYQFEDFLDCQKVLIPPLDIQSRFDAIVAPMLNQIQILGEKNQLLKQTRDLLLPRLISGKLSVEHLIEDQIVEENQSSE